MKNSADRCNDGSTAGPRLRRDIHIGSLLELPRASRGWRASTTEQLDMLKLDGYEAVQSWDQFDQIIAAGLRATGIARVMQPHEAELIAKSHKESGLDMTVLHVGNSFETDQQMDALVGAVLNAATKHGYRLYIETHRGTLTQDIRRTLDLIERFPEVRFNADLSHWYTGHELTYGGEFLSRIEYLQPVFERVRSMHGRIGNTGAIQTSLTNEGPYLAHFRILWQRCFEGFLRGAQAGDYLSFNPELLPMKAGQGEDAIWFCYAQRRNDLLSDALQGEASDRYEDAALLWQIANECFNAARGDRNVCPE